MARNSDKELKYTIVEHVADLREPDSKGWVLQLNVMTWGNFKNEVIDIRKWQYKDDGTVVAGKGITMGLEDLVALQKINVKNLERYFVKEDEDSDDE